MTMRHLTLICMAGISTSLLVNKMKRLIRNENLEIAVTAMSERAFQGYTGQTDVLLLGPQLGHRFESLKEQYESRPDHNKIFEVEARIGGKAWGRGKGSSKKSAEQQAAYEAILNLRKKK